MEFSAEYILRIGYFVFYILREEIEINGNSFNVSIILP